MINEYIINSISTNLSAGMFSFLRLAPDASAVQRIWKPSLLYCCLYNLSQEFDTCILDACVWHLLIFWAISDKTKLPVTYPTLTLYVSRFPLLFPIIFCYFLCTAVFPSALMKKLLDLKMWSSILRNWIKILQHLTKCVLFTVALSWLD